MHIIFAYDSPNNKRRERLRKSLLQYGNAVQRSVFELDVSQSQLQEIRKIVKAIIKADEDNFRYYFICAACAKQVETFGGKQLNKNPLTYIV